MSKSIPDLTDPDESFRFFMSVILTLIGSSLSTLGLILMKLSHDKV